MIIYSTFAIFTNQDFDIIRAAMANFWQKRPPQWQSHNQYATTPVPAFYSSKSRQDLALGASIKEGPCLDQAHRPTSRSLAENIISNLMIYLVPYSE
jgi:hypothetical protein